MKYESITLCKDLDNEYRLPGYLQFVYVPVSEPAIWDLGLKGLGYGFMSMSPSRSLSFRGLGLKDLGYGFMSMSPSRSLSFRGFGFAICDLGLRVQGLGSRG